MTLSATISNKIIQVKCALGLLLFAGFLAIVIGCSVLFLTLRSDSTSSSLGLRSVGILFLAAGFFGLLTGSMVRFSANKTTPAVPTRISRSSANRNHQIPASRSFHREDSIYVEINGAVSLLPNRFPMYPQEFFDIARRVKDEQTSFVAKLPSYDTVLRDSSGSKFEIIPCEAPPPYEP